MANYAICRSSQVSSGTPAALKSFAENFPISLVRKPTRHVYDSFPLNISAEMYVLDTRCGFLGGKQTEWLTGALEGSSSKWKIILSYSSGSYTRVVNQSKVEVAAQTKEELEEQARAAAVIQSKVRAF